MKPHPWVEVFGGSFRGYRRSHGVRSSLLLAAVIGVSCGGGQPGPDLRASASGGAGGSASRDAGGASGAPSPTSSAISASESDGGSIVIEIGRGGSPTSTGGAFTQEPPECGNGKQEQGEACDDGNQDSGDGCSFDCANREEGYVCAEPGKACRLSQVCGDKIISGTENCDDGNTSSDDGCSDDCHVEIDSGWTCPVAGARCIAAKCGDGLVVGAETCDDGNQDSGDGCSATCSVESAGIGERDAWVCPAPGEACQHTVCGDGKVEGTEPCDDGNNDSGDGCTPACRKEPSCPPAGGACKSVCGDGMILSDDDDQECDDGNSADGDGCSSSCTKEQGYECVDAEIVPSGKLTLPIVYRDFKGGTIIPDAAGGAGGSGGDRTPVRGLPRQTTADTANGEHPDFESQPMIGEVGIVQAKLGTDSKPMHVVDTDMETTTNNNTSSTPNWFSLWYRDAVADLPTAGSPRYNYTFVEWLTLVETAADSGAFRFSSNSFFPLDGRGWGATAGQTHNYHFTSEVRYWFQYSGNELLTFT